jgi:hypothetical protein
MPKGYEKLASEEESRAEKEDRERRKQQAQSDKSNGNRMSITHEISCFDFRSITGSCSFL